jgi:hypothetical protein
MLSKIVMHTTFATTFCLAVVACDAEDVDVEGRLLEAELCMIPSEHEGVRLELRDLEVAEAASAPSDVAPSVFVDYEGTRIELRDDGLGPDHTANDGIFTAERPTIAPPSDTYCLPVTEDLVADEAAPAASRPRPQSLGVHVDPLAAAPEGGGCHDWKVAPLDNGMEIWYCGCYSWDVWSC